MTTAATLLLERFADVLATPQDVERLNQAILELAVRGKLTQQNALEEPASELLKRTLAERAKTNDKPLPPIGDDEKPFDLPKSWEWSRVGEIAYGFRGHNPPKHEFIYQPRKGYVRFIQITDFKTEECAVYVPISPQNKMVYKGEIIIAAYRHIGKLSREMEGAFNVALCKVMEFAPMSRDYLELLIGTNFVKGELLKASGRAHIPSMHLDHLLSLVIPLPPLAEQQRIVERIEQLFAQTRRLAELLAHAQTDLTNLNASALAHLLSAETPEEFEHQWQFVVEHFDLLLSDPAHVAPLRQTILELAVRGKLTRQDANDEPASTLLKRIQAEKVRLVEEGKLGKSDPLPPVNDDEKPFAVPKGWEWVTLSHLSWDAGYGTSEKCDYETDGFPVLRIPNVINGNIDLHDLKYAIKSDKLDQKDALEPNDLLIVRTNGSKELIGRFGLVRKPLDKPHFFASYLIRYRIVETADIAQWISILGNAPIIRQQMVRIAATTAGQYNVSIDRLRKVFFPLPPAAEQQRIVAQVEQLLAQCDALEAKLRAAQTNRERLVQSVMAGIAAG